MAALAISRPIDRGSALTEANSRGRLGVVGVIVMALFSGLFVRLWFLQIGGSSADAVEQTRANRTRTVTEPGVRGSILDRNGNVLVRDELIDSIVVRRGMTPEERERTIPNLANLLNVKPKEIEKRIESPRYSPFEAVPIADNVSYDTIVSIKQRPEEFPKVDAVRRSVRTYPYLVGQGDDERPIAPHLLGYVGEPNKREQRLHEGEGYHVDDLIGKDGVEQMFESELRGEPHIRELVVDSRGRLVEVKKDTPATAGNDIQLTMDADIQRITEESLEQGMTQARKIRDINDNSRFKTFNAGGGAAIVIDARDGSVLSFASAPDFNVSDFTNGIPVDQFEKLTAPDSDFPLLNRVTQGLYAPGSTFKLISSIAALETGTYTPDFSFDDRGSVKFGNPPQEFNNAGKTPHGPVDLERALTVSSDVYYYNLGFLLWKDFSNGNEKQGYAIQSTAERFGFDQPTGVGLPNEANGRLPDEKFKEDLNRNSDDEFSREWLPGDSANIAVGQGDVLVTPIRLATAYAAFANGGKLFTPRLAQQVRSPGDGSVIRDLPSQEAGTVTISKEVYDAVMPGLLGAVNSGEGTARSAFNGYIGTGPTLVAGKTGTAEVAGRQDNALFVGIVNPTPASPDEPQYVVVVVVEEAGFGGSVAAPIARRIIDSINNPFEVPAGVRVTPPKDD